MTFPNIFTVEVSESIVDRINELKPDSEREWGTMNPAQMLAHCNIAYETIYEPQKHAPPNFVMKFILRNFVKGIIVNDKLPKRNSPTASIFKVSPDKDFDFEKARLIEYIRRTRELGESTFDGKESPSFGTMTSSEWNNMMYKHLDHHLRQFGK